MKNTPSPPSRKTLLFTIYSSASVATVFFGGSTDFIMQILKRGGKSWDPSSHMFIKCRGREEGGSGCISTKKEEGWRNWEGVKRDRKGLIKWSDSNLIKSGWSLCWLDVGGGKCVLFLVKSSPGARGKIYLRLGKYWQYFGFDWCAFRGPWGTDKVCSSLRSLFWSSLKLQEKAQLFRDSLKLGH